jgi:DNA (cytosine-5)-methyltransferase 1
MTAYYNENDPGAAAWLRELIRKGLIAKGEVDVRSIEDIAPIDLQGFTQCHFFCRHRWMVIRSRPSKLAG